MAEIARVRQQRVGELGQLPLRHLSHTQKSVIYLHRCVISGFQTYDEVIHAANRLIFHTETCPSYTPRNVAPADANVFQLRTMVEIFKNLNLDKSLFSELFCKSTETHIRACML